MKRNRPNVNQLLSLFGDFGEWLTKVQNVNDSKSFGPQQENRLSQKGLRKRAHWPNARKTHIGG